LDTFKDFKAQAGSLLNDIEKSILNKTLMKYFLIAYCASFVVPISYGQDSLVRYNEISYQTDFERVSFKKYLKQNKPEATLDLLLSTSPDAQSKIQSISNQIETISLKLKTSVEGKKPEKKIKLVYDQVHFTFLKKYELVNTFAEVFATGNYNCVTATALYALVFDELQIPYNIQEKPTHVFLVAYPNQNNIVVETTSPLFGYLSFDARYKESFVNNLKGSKLIGASEAATQSVDELFNRYFFKNENIDLKKLIGIHYMNDALYKNDVGNVAEAFQQCEKAYLFYPSPRSSFLLTGFAAQLLEKEKIKPTQRAWLIAKVSRYTEQGVTTEMVKGEFYKLTQEVLVKENNRSLYKDCFDIVVRHGNRSSETISEIRYIYNYELGRINLNQGNYFDAKNYFAKAMEEQPNNIDLGGTFFGTLAMTMNTNRENEIPLDSLLMYKEKFPSLRQNNNFNSLIGNAYLLSYTKEMEKGNVQKAEGMIKIFEEMIAANKNLVVDSYTIGQAYSKGCTYYFKKGMKEKAKAILKKGLEISPNNFELRTRQQMIH
jgi:tetratricopeptide (TPR) repeat protein